MNEPPWTRSGIAAHSRLLAESFRRWLGRPLVPETVGSGGLARYLYEAPFVLVSHGTEADPLFNYANLAAQRLWEMDWDAMVGMPSRRSAEAGERGQRSLALGDASRQGFTQGYSGIRISSSGRRFRILDGIIWNLLDDAGRYRGQAATFSRWDPV